MSHPLLSHWSELADSDPPRLFRPDTEAQLQQFFQTSSEPCLLTGAGTKWWLGNVPSASPVIIDMRGFDRIFEYSPADLTITAGAGVMLEDLNRLAGSHAQMLPADPPPTEGATLGGLVSVGVSGPLQQVYGSVRDKVLGVKVMHADGSITRAGGKVVKNVAGFDLCKLYTGAFGTIAALLEITLRLYARPEQTLSCAIPASDVSAAASVFGTLRQFATRPAGVLYEGPRGRVLARFCGVAAVVQELAEKTTLRYPEARITPDDAVSQAISEFYGKPDPVRLRIESLVSCLPDVYQAARQVAAASSMPVIDFSSSRIHVSAAELEPDALAGLRSELAGRAAVIVERAPLSLRRLINVWSTFPGETGLARKIKLAFDPQGRLNPGRYVTRP
jgi:glycolate oxidase FAD binding subunit